MKKLSLLLAIVMTIALFVPCFAFSVAAEGETGNVCEVTDGTTTTQYATVAEGVAALSSGKTLKLLADASVTATIALKGNVVFDGNGYSLTTARFSGDSLFTVAAGADANYLDASKTATDVATLATGAATIKNVNLKTSANMVFIVGHKTTLNLIDVNVDAAGYITRAQSFVDYVINISGGSYTGTVAGAYIIGGQGNGEFNFYNGYFENKATSDARTMQFEVACVANFYGGVYVHDTYRDVIKALGDNDGTNGNPVCNLYGGTFINGNAKGRNGDLFCVLGEKDGVVNDCTFALCLQPELNNGSSSKSPEKEKGTVSDLNAKADQFALGGKNYYLSAQKEIPVTDVAEAAIKFSPAGNGIRFASTIKADLIAYAEEKNDANTEITYGTIIVPADYANKYGIYSDMILGQDKPVVDIKADKGLTQNQDGSVTFTAALINIKTGNMDRDFAAITYIEYVVDGMTVRNYGLYDAANNVSLADLAVAALAGDVSGYTAEQKAALEVYAAYAVAAE